MSGFSPEWLALREPADHRSRNGQLRDAAVRAFDGRTHISIADFACGTGSNLRALAPYLPEHQTWRLVDADAGLLSAARYALTDYAEEITSRDPLIFRKNGRLIRVTFECLDLNMHLEQALEKPVDLVTAAAFFDLVSPEW